MKRELTTSNRLIAIVGIFAVVAVLDAVVLAYGLSLVRNDARVVNYAGIVRGSIQRISKCEFGGSPDDAIIDGLNDLFDDFDAGRSGLDLRGFDSGFRMRFDLLHQQWHRVEDAIAVHRGNPDAQTATALFEESETAWELANDAVFAAQESAETKQRLFKFLFVLIVINVAGLVILGFLIRNHVRNRLEVLAHQDALTGVYNRHTFDIIIHRELEKAERYGGALSVLMADIDRFKRINDTHGHETGDQVLVTLADIIENTIRKSDVLCRIGGEEFVIIAASTDSTNVAVLAEKVRSVVEEQDFGGVGRVTVSIGSATFGQGDTKDSLLKRADEALYRAKATGRNRVETDSGEA